MENVIREAEKPINGYLACFRFYDSKKRRLSIFGRIITLDKGTPEQQEVLEITVLTLSNTPEVKQYFGKGGKKLRRVDVLYDTFSRKDGREKYETKCLCEDCKDCPGQRVVIPIIENRPRYSFLKWCNERYYRPQKQKVTIEKVTFVRGTKFVHPEKKKKEVVEETPTPATSE